MKTEIDYSSYTNEQEKRDKAIADIEWWLNNRQYNGLVTLAMELPTYKQFSFYCDFVGISGYPVVALWDETRQIMKDMTT